jgi:3-hydroxyacyl-[acyl-carrier-protein] dehydratase
MMNIDEVMKQLPHRYPFLLVDFVEEITDEKIIAVKNCTINEPFFQGHFPKYPIYPGVLQLEGLAQTAGILLKEKFGTEFGDKGIPLFIGVDKARFKSEIRPGDVLRYEVKVDDKRDALFWVSGKITCGERICTRAKLMLGFKTE